MNDDEAEYYYRGDFEHDSRRSFLDWLQYVFQNRTSAIIGSGIIMALLGWWATAYLAPVLFFIAYFAVVKLMAKYGRKDPALVIETNLQGEVITHCARMERPIFVTSTGIRVRVIPASRIQDIVSFGDPAPPVQTRNLLICDYYEELPTGEIILVYPRNRQFSNLALVGRINQDLADAMARIGDAWKANEAFRELAMDAYERGQLGGTEGEAVQKLRSLLGQGAETERILVNTSAAGRDLFLFYKDTIPALEKELVMMKQEFPRLVMAETAKWLHKLNRHPMSQAIHDRITAVLGSTEMVDYETRNRALVKRQINGEGNPNPVSPVEGDTRYAR